MSVVIRMEMPINCWYCQCCHKDTLGCFRCGITRISIEKFKNRPLWCPIVCELPNTHGNLVDFDDVKKELDKLFSYLEQLPESFYQPELYRKQCIIPEGFIEIPSIVLAEYSTSKVKKTEDVKP